MQIRLGKINPEKGFFYYYLPNWTLSMWKLFYNIDFTLQEIRLKISTATDNLLLEKSLHNPTGLFFFNYKNSEELKIEYYYNNKRLLSISSKIDSKLTDDKIYFSSGGWISRMVGEGN
ncbi:hypothetical protein CTH_1424 [Carboxydocella thermautotrophica]|nr:hypothetical protein CTH_1424 [Carboxydocella thermautotrophica]